MQFTKPAIVERKLRIIESLIYENELVIERWKTRQGMYRGENRYTDVEPEWSSVAVGDSWKCCADLTRWFAAAVTVPEAFAGKPLALELDFGGESIVRVNGKIVSSVTAYHDHRMLSAARRRILLSDCAVAGETYEIELESQLNYLEFNYFGGGARSVEPIYETYRIQKASLVALNAEVESYYFDLLTAFEAMKALENPLDRVVRAQDNLPHDIVSLLERGGKDHYYCDKTADAVICSVSLLDFDLGREAFLASVPAAREVLKKKLGEIPYLPHAAVKFVGQSHIDAAWLWPLRESQRKCAKTLSNVCDLMDRYPEFTFAFSQPQLFEYTRQNYPEVYARVKEKVAEGRLEPVGNTWVEMDSNIPSGESLVRQLLYGRQYFMREFGKVSEIFWMPDVFGYSWALPQIIKRSGMKYFFTSKLNNNDDHRFPHSLFLWQGIDGTRVVSYLQRLTYNGVINPDTLQTLYRRFDQKSVCGTSLMTFGFGDGGGGPSYQMLETAARLKRFPGLPALEFGTAASFFEEAGKTADSLPVWNDEMYYEFHRGTYTSQADVKKNNRKCEFLYRAAEMAAVMARLDRGREYPYAELLDGYRKLLANQFHDILPGSSVHSVYQDAAKDYAEIRETGERILGKSMQALSDGIPRAPGTENGLTVFNFLSWERTGLVETDLPDCYQCPAVEGTESAVTEEEGRRKLRFFAELPAMGYRRFKLTESPGRPDKTEKIRVTPGCMENTFFRILLDGEARMISIWDKRNRREVLAGPSNLLRIFEDKPSHETAWNIDLEYQNKSWAPELACPAEVAEQTAVRGVLRVKRTFNLSSFEQDIILYSELPRIDFVNRVDWRETEKMLKAEFNADLLSSKAAYEIQFGAIERSTHRNTSYDRTKFEVCGHKWADLSEGRYGAALLNDCKYGYDINGGRMRLTLLRAPTDPDPVADKGFHTFTYSFYPHRGNWVEAGVVAAGYELNQPPVVSFGPCSGGEDRKSYFSCEGAVIDTVKCAEDGNGIILRVYESSGSKTNACLALNLPCAGIRECNLMEEDEQPLECGSGKLSFVIRPYEIKTFRIVQPDEKETVRS